jgi:lysophospholipase L1-like esterase
MGKSASASRLCLAHVLKNKARPTAPSTSELSRGRRLLYYAAAVTLSLMVAVFAAEVIVRRVELQSWRGVIHSLLSGTPFSAIKPGAWLLSDPVLGYRMTPGVRGTNSLGLRNPEIPVHKPSGELRLIVLGDSVSADPDGYVAILRQKLDGRIHVINAAVPGYTTYQERLFLERHLLALEPDFVVLQYCLNDNHRFLHRIDPEGGVLHTPQADRALRPKEGDPLSWLPSGSFLAHRVRAALAHPRDEASAFHWELFPDFYPAWQEESWEDWKAQLQGIEDLLRPCGAKLTVVAAPYVPQIDPRLPSQARNIAFLPQRYLATACRQLDAPLLDLTPAIESQGSWKLFRDILHFNPEGHQVVAKAVYEHLQALGWIPDPR